MEKYRKMWKEIVFQALGKIAPDTAAVRASFTPDSIPAETPPDPALGDIAFPMFPFAKLFKAAPARIAGLLESLTISPTGRARAAGPYLNVTLDRPAVFREVFGRVFAEGDAYGANGSRAGERVMLEFSSPNTNKPLHLGHLRNDALGECAASLLKRCGAEVLKVNLINDRGVHICKSMLAYKKYGNDRTPESEGVKSDHFVGDYYVKFAQWAKDDPDADNQARELLKAWEAGDPETIALWEKMNRWAVEGHKRTYEATGVSFDRYYFEHETYTAGREVILQGLKKGLFYRKEDNSVWVDLTADGLDEKVLLRGDGTSLYVTQDIGTAVVRAEDWPFDRLVFVTGNEQIYHFRMLFIVLRKLGYPWAEKMNHLPYGMVNLPEGKMKSREGTVVDADDLLAELTADAVEEIRAREREGEIEDVSAAARKIALGAMNYFLLAFAPHKDIVFDPKESISFNGDTGPYLQYSGARLSSILRKYEERKERYEKGAVDYLLLKESDEWELAKRFAEFPALVAKAAADLDPSLITSFLYDCAKLFAHYYHDHQVLGNDDPSLVLTRLDLVRALREVLRSGFLIIGVPFLDAM
ncbi:MAG: arginine--tRNA ligase [Spirochaetales bacterium]|nr:arginine--tRNA ligase [Spirochaetales bacterium]